MAIFYVNLVQPVTFKLCSSMVFLSLFWKNTTGDIWSRFFKFAPHRGVKYCDQYIHTCVCLFLFCLSVCSGILKTTCPNFTKFLVRVTCGYISVFFWWQCSTLGTLVLWMTLCCHILDWIKDDKMHMFRGVCLRVKSVVCECSLLQSGFCCRSLFSSITSLKGTVVVTESDGSWVGYLRT